MTTEAAKYLGKIVEILFVRPGEVLPGDEIRTDPEEKEKWAAILRNELAKVQDYLAHLEPKVQTPERSVLIRRPVV